MVRGARPARPCPRPRGHAAQVSVAVGRESIDGRSPESIRDRPLRNGLHRRSDGGMERLDDTQRAPAAGPRRSWRWSIRRQILVPLIAIPAAPVAATAIPTRAVAAP